MPDSGLWNPSDDGAGNRVGKDEVKSHSVVFCVSSPKKSEFSIRV